jgi:putative methyltransferase (TIGR04325 family)
MGESVLVGPPAAANIGTDQPAYRRQGGLGRRLVRLRLAQVRAASALMRELCRVGRVSSLVACVRKWPMVRQVVDFAAGYNRVFPDLASAQSAAQSYGVQGHGSDENVRVLQDLMTRTRPSDYPVLFHLGRLRLEGLRVFDLGGTMGDLFYLYDRYLDFPAGLRWTVHDLPGNMARGIEFARQQQESRLEFSDDLHGASGDDVLLVSGALHYFDFTLADYIARLPQRPGHVIVNRTPLVDAPTAATVQHTDVMVGCRLLNRAELVGQMANLGYRAADAWSVPEFSIKLPYDPEYWVREYSGIYFRAEDQGT